MGARFALGVVAALLAVAVTLGGPALAATRGIEVAVKASEAPGAAVVETVRLYGASYALVIGIDAYTNGWPRLSNGVNDAHAVAAELESRGFEVTLRTDIDSAGLKSAFEQFYVVKGADPEARLLVWFSGHGATVGGEAFLVPADAPPPQAGTGFKLTALSLRRFGEFVRLAESKHALAVFDSCFAGTIFEAQRTAPPPAITRATTLPVRQFLTSGDAGQTVSDDGTFRKLFLRALRGEEPANGNGDGYLTASELGLYLSDRIVNLRLGQTPRYGKLRDPDYDRGDFVFVLPDAEGGGSAPAAERVLVAADLQVWREIKDSTNAADFVTFIESFPSSQMLPYARNKLKSLMGVETALVAPPEPETEVQPSQDEVEAAISVARASQEAGARDADERVRAAFVLVQRRRDALERLGAVDDRAILQTLVDRIDLEELEPPMSAGEVFKDCAQCPEMVAIPAGEFVMGSAKNEVGRFDNEGPQHTVRMRQPFAMGKYEVTFAEWDACVADGACRRGVRDEGWGRGQRPAINVSWDDAKAYLDWLSRKTGRPSYGLPSESEWEYAARAGTTAARFWGESADRGCVYANALDLTYRGTFKEELLGTGWYAMADCDDGYVQTAPVGSFEANGFGLHDMLGNVFELVGDCWNDSYRGAPVNGAARRDGYCDLPILRGGSWAHGTSIVRAAFRSRDDSGARGRAKTIGFRVARRLSLGELPAAKK